MFVPIIVLIIAEGELGDVHSRLSAAQECDMLTTVNGEDLCIRYRFENSGRLLLVTLIQQFPEGFAMPSVRSTFLLWKDRDVRVTARMHTGGMFTIPAPYVIVSDLLGFSKRKIQFGEAREVTILASIARMRTELFKPKNYRMLPGNIVSRYAGSGYEFHSIRKYEEGQPLRHVNWKTSARLDELWMNEFVSERSGTTLIILDVRMIDMNEEITANFAGRATFAASSIAYSAAMERNSIGMLVLGERLFRVKADYGIRQFRRISHLLASTGVSRHSSPAQIDRAAEVYGHAYEQYVVISPLADDETVDSVASLSLNVRDVWTIVPLIFEKTSPDSGENVARELLRITQQNNAIRLSRVCRAVVWDRNESLESAIETAGKITTGRFR